MTSPQDKHWLDTAIENTAPGKQPEPDYKTWQQKHPQALASLLQRAQENVRPRTDLSAVIELGRRIMRSPITKLAMAAVFIVGCLFLARHLKGGDTVPSPKPTIVKEIKPEETPSNESTLARTLYEQKDLPGLLALLETGQEATQITIAELLAEIGDGSTISALQRLADTLDNTELRTAIQVSILTIQKRLNLVGPEDLNELPSLDPNVQINREVSVSDKGLLLTLLDAETDQPVQGVPVKVTYRYEQAQNKEEILTANTAGQCRFTWEGEAPDSLYIRILSPAHVYKILDWNPGRDGIAIPGSYMSYLNQGVTIGGTVQTETGDPIEDVVVSVGSSIRAGHKTERDTTFSSRRQVRTDAQGRWTYEHFPPDGDPSVKVKHPDYVSTQRTVWSPSMEALLNRSSIVLMCPGLTLTGCAVDTLGLPVEGVEVLQGWDYWIDKDQTITDSEGRFSFDRRIPGPTILTVVMPGYAQDMQEIQVTEGMSDIEFVLQPASLLMLQVNDSHEKAIQGCSVTARAWRRMEYANDRSHSIRGKALTDKAGRAVLYDLPLDEVLYDIQAKGFASLDDYALTASGHVQTVTLTPQGKLKGRVLNAETGETISQFTLDEGIQWNPDERTVWQDNTRHVTNGQYEMTFRYQNRGMALRFEAEGYLPTETDVYFNDGTEILKDVTLTKGTELSGWVMNPDGTPSQDAKMLIATARGGNVVRDGVIEDVRESWRMVSLDENGHFSFAAPNEAFKVVVVSELGMAEVSEAQFLNDSKIRLEAWAQVEGQVSTGDQPAANQTVSLRRPSDFRNPDAVRVSDPKQMRTDAEGRFAFTKVKPGTMTVRSQDRTITLEVNAGKTTEVQLGGGGRNAVGSLVLSEASHGLDTSKCLVSIRSAQEIPTELPLVSLPEDYLLMDGAQQSQWRQAWFQTDEGRAYGRIYKRVQALRTPAPCIVNLEATGELLIEDVLPGYYELVIRLDNPNRGFWGDRALVGRLEHAFSIPDAGDDDYYTVPVDLGVITVPVVLPVRLGLIAPEFSMTGLDGRSCSLSDFRGGCLLLDIPAEGIVPDQEIRKREILKQLQADYGTSGELTVLSVMPSVWPHANMFGPLKNLMTWEGLNWTFGVIDQAHRRTFSNGYYRWGRNEKEDRYHSPILIAPDGTVLELDIPLDELFQTVQQALEK